ncbi:MAG: hypothetical protein HY864_17145 [Chloroflexi bacterium]|nr:hypothetical protein [Chloroflexota bacterium]
MKRIGDLLLQKNKTTTGEHRYIKAAENLANKVLFPEVDKDEDKYIHGKPQIESPKIPGFPQDITYISEYEAMLLGKLLNPSNPVLCIEGPAGSGKTTTLNYLLSVIRKIHETSFENNVGLLSANIDFRRHSHGELGTIKLSLDNSQKVIDNLINEICMELYSRCKEFIKDKEEYGVFWNEIIKKYKGHENSDIAHVARRLLDEAPELYDTCSMPFSNEELNKRKAIMDGLKPKSSFWHLSYLILLWRYWIETRYKGHRGKAFVILDNLDSLSPHLQRQILDFVMKAANYEGPIFVLALRPETRMRQGLADTLLDVIIQDGPTPMDVVCERVKHFLSTSNKFFIPTLGLTEDQFKLIHNFLTRIHSQLASGDGIFKDFINYAAGRNIRLGLIIAQGLFLTTIADMTAEELSQHFLIRSCIRQGEQQFSGSVKSPVENIFHTNGITDDARLLVKFRILKFLEHNDGECALSILRSTFVLFGYQENYIKSALNDLLRNECQIIRSDGYDVFRDDWGDEQETLYLTAKGKGYAENIIFDTNYIQEVMLDCRIDENKWPVQAPFDYLSEKLTVLRLFLRDLHRIDSEEVESFVKRLRIGKYHELFGTRLLTLTAIQKVYQSVGKIIYATVNKHPYQRDNYREILDEFTSLLRQAEHSNKRIIGIEPEPIDAFEIR